MSLTRGTICLNGCLRSTAEKKLIGPCPRMNQTMTKLSKMENSNYTTLMRVLFGLESPTPLPDDLTELSDQAKNVPFVDPTLNESQKGAIRFALASREVALIHGPPGVSQTLSNLCPANPEIDRQNVHPHRIDPPTCPSQSAGPCLRSLQHLR